MTTWMIAMRTSVIDRFVINAMARGVNTFVNLGAGLDTRPYRMDLPPDLVWIEVDYPDVIEFKQTRLEGESPHCKLEQVGIDLADRGSRRAPFDRIGRDDAKVLALAEGVVIYLDSDAVAELADDLRAAPGVESWVVDYFSPEMMEYRRKAGLGSQMASAQFKFQPDDWWGFFAEHGWKSAEISYLPEEAMRVRRPAPLPLKIRLIRTLLMPFVPAALRQTMGQYVGYARLEPS